MGGGHNNNVSLKFCLSPALQVCVLKRQDTDDETFCSCVIGHSLGISQTEHPVQTGFKVATVHSVLRTPKYCLQVGSESRCAVSARPSAVNMLSKN